ncbi:hypothetical protein Ais01nite_14990 [Asanoa ishikariensis]|uniref:Uncharacterized protein n=1 Tax=Asanoa ishikariensis TaxID=137265 RepID=A0A1H3UJ92_9ACTN|nr:hypothetical protein [Asanoa ishikariensis]GIF63464.1 hypothetical protein Ais01nite_14990 [Asanoa ishikariensis]SDZ62081.1 hypothetical protein SAMN05421684_7374 [Asanoa ishikariensis]
MTPFEESYYHLILLDPALRKGWLLDNRPADVSPAHWWFSLIDSAVSDVRHQHLGFASTRPQADQALAAALIDWALERPFPLVIAVQRLAQLLSIAFDAGQMVEELPVNVRPDAIARLALDGFAMTREHAIARAASLRAKPLTEDDLYQPGQDPAIFEALTQTDDYRDYHRLFDFDRMLTCLAPFVDLIADPDLAGELRRWLAVQPDLDPVPTAIMLLGTAARSAPPE